MSEEKATITLKFTIPLNKGDGDLPEVWATEFLHWLNHEQEEWEGLEVEVVEEARWVSA